MQLPGLGQVPLWPTGSPRTQPGSRGAGELQSSPCAGRGEDGFAPVTFWRRQGGQRLPRTRPGTPSSGHLCLELCGPGLELAPAPPLPGGDRELVLSFFGGPATPWAAICLESQRCPYHLGPHICGVPGSSRGPMTPMT